MEIASRSVQARVSPVSTVRYMLKHKKEKISLVELGSHLRIEEGLRAQEKDKEKETLGSSTVNMMEEGSQYGNKNKGKKRPSNNTHNGPNKKRSPKGNGCWNCGKPGHFKRDCRAGKGKNGNNPNQSAQGSKDQGQKPHQGQKGTVPSEGTVTNLVAFSGSDYVSNISEAFFMQDDEVAWWVDSGATAHVCRDRTAFKSFVPLHGRVLRMGNESTAPVLGEGQVELEFSSGKTLILSNVLFVPRIRKNLVSGTILNKLGFRQVYEADKYILCKGGLFIGRGYLCNGMFKLSISKVVTSVYMTCAQGSVPSEGTVSSLWHARLGHVHYQRMHDMSKSGLIPEFDMNIEKCKTCMLTKITRQPFPGVQRESSMLDLIHSDLCDFHASPSLGNKKYVVTYIDDYSRYCYVFLLHAKDEALGKFKIYKNEVELQKGSLIKRLRTDRGGEYFDPDYFQSVGIIHETTAPYTPQQNGVSERKNRVLKEMVNSMLSYSGLNDGFWGEAMLTACYLLNRVPNKRNKVTPYELWFKKTPNLNYIRVWGCRAVVRLPDPKHKTLGEKGVECIFIGYAEHSKAYRFYVIEPNKSISVHTVIESRDAIFDERRFSSSPIPKDLVPGSSSDQEVIVPD